MAYKISLELKMILRQFYVFLLLCYIYFNKHVG